MIPKTLQQIETADNQTLAPFFTALLGVPEGSSFPKDSLLYTVAESLRHETGMPLANAMNTIRITLQSLAMKRLLSLNGAPAILSPLQDEAQPDTSIDVLIEPESHAIVFTPRIAGEGIADTLLLERYDGQLQLRIMPDQNTEPRLVIPLQVS